MKRLIFALVAACSLLAVSSFGAVAETAADLFKARCASCHGDDGSSTKGGMQALKGMSGEAVRKALEGYAAGTFGGEKKAVMQKIAAKLSPEEIKELSAHIATFK